MLSKALNLQLLGFCKLTIKKEEPEILFEIMQPHLEAAAIAEKRKDGGIIISGKTMKAGHKNLQVEKLDISTVKGKTQSVEVFLLKSERSKC